MVTALQEEGLDDTVVVTGLDFGHSDPMWTLPLGARVGVDSEVRTIEFPDPVTV